MGLGSSKSRGKTKEPKNAFDRQREEEKTRYQQKEDKTKQQDASKKKQGSNAAMAPPPRPERTDLRPNISYDQEAVDRMRNQLKHDPTSFLLNNLMLSVQFFDNYERVMNDLRNNSISESDKQLNDNMAMHHRHVFSPDKLQEAVDTNVLFVNKYRWTDDIRDNKTRNTLMNASNNFSSKMETLQARRMFVVHDNIEINEPNEDPDYSTVIGSPHYKMVIETSDEPGYVKLRKIETPNEIKYDETDVSSNPKSTTESDRDSDSSDANDTEPKNEEKSESTNFMNDLKSRINQPPKPAFKKEDLNRNIYKPPEVVRFSSDDPTKRNSTPAMIDTERRLSGILKNSNTAVQKGNLSVQSESKTKRKMHRDNDNDKKGRKSQANGSESSGYKSSHSPQTESSGNESDYGYATITYEATPRRLELSEMTRITDSTSVIPFKCITSIRVKRKLGVYDDDEPYPARYGKDFQRELFKNVRYLNSSMFMSNFKDLFLIKLGESLEFDRNRIEQALTQGASIYCNSKSQNTKTVEVIPAINTAWPYDVNEWMLRPRKIITNPRSNFTYQWPTQHMVIKSHSLGCSIVPIGFRTTRGNNPQKHLQWKITFPAVERYLETCMAHSQVRCYLFTIAVFKTFVKIESSKLGLDNEHFKNHLFWQLEDNFAKWPEDRLGEAFILFFKSFYQLLMKRNLPDYFIRQCNTLKSIPTTILSKQQRLLADIIESPVMHLLICLKNLKYVKSEYYPVLDYKELYVILTATDTLRLMNPNIPYFAEDPIDEDELELEVRQRNFWDAKKTEENPEYMWKIQQLREVETRKAAEKLKLERKNIKPQMDRKKKVPVLDINRKQRILQFFIPHFISMADWSMNFDAPKQAMIYLDQAQRLSTLLKEEPAFEGQARNYLEEIWGKIDHVRANMIKINAPQVPQRNSLDQNSNIRRDSKRSSQQYINISRNNSIREDGNDIDSPTIKFNGVVFADIHSDSEKVKTKTVTIEKLDEEESECSIEESRL